MKKYILLFLMTFLCFFSIDKVYAESIDFVPGGMNWYTSDGTYGDSGAYAYTIDGVTFYGHGYLPVDVQKLQFGYFTTVGLSQSYYDIDFVFYGGSGNYTDIIATFDDNVCTVQKTGTFYGSISGTNGFLTTGNGYYYTIHCNDYYPHDGWTNLSIYFPTPVKQVSGTSMFAISKKVGANFGQKQYVVSGDNRSEEIKNTIKDINEKIGNTNSKLDEQNQLAKDKLEQDKKQHEEIMDDDTSGANSEAESFFSGFTTNTHGLTSIITSPLELIGNIAGSTCTPLQLPLPYVVTDLTLPCMDTIYKKHFGSLFSVYQLITFGYISYWVCVRIFALVKDFKNPDHDEIEVMDL